jgi:RHS repeat-associated protein
VSGSSPKLLAAGPTSYVYGPGGQPVEQVTGSAATFLIADQQGNTHLLTSATGTVTGTYRYGPYGTPAYSCPSGTSGTSDLGGSCATTALQYGGQYTDSASGDLYLGSRYYDPATGQYLTRPAAGANALASYAFAGDDPVNSGFTSLTWTPEDAAPGFWSEAATFAGEFGEAASLSGGDDPVSASGSATCQQFLVNQLKQVDTHGLIDFINDSVDAAQTHRPAGRQEGGLTIVSATNSCD